MGRSLFNCFCMGLVLSHLVVILHCIYVHSLFTLYLTLRTLVDLHHPRRGERGVRHCGPKRRRHIFW